MATQTLEGKRYVVVGLGKSGTGAADLLLRRGAKVTALDENPKATAPFTSPNFELHAGAFPTRFWEGAEAVVVSPGVALSKPELVAARAAGAMMFGEIELAWSFMPKGAGPILGVTGTNGKSTTTALLGEIVKHHVPNTFVGGNLGTAFTTAYADPAQAPYAMHVIELSSFQLEGIHQAQFLGGAILNLTPDHLDRYASHQAYGAAKLRLLTHLTQDGFGVVNLDDHDALKLGKASRATLYGFTLDADRTNMGLAGVAIGSSQQFSVGLHDYVVRNKALRGAHNIQNAMAAALMAANAGIPPGAIQKGLDSFPGLAHRLEFVRELEGVEWINDSKATNVDSSVMALRALSGGVWLLAGGKGKGAPYAPLVAASRGKVRGVLTIGQDGPSVAKAYEGVCPIESCETLEVAVKRAHTLAKRGDTVLLSPACASYDQFNNFEHRGDTFKQLVRSL